MLYFFKSTFAEQYIRSIESFGSKRDLDKSCVAQFEQIFPKYTWGQKSFYIRYSCGDYWLSLEGKLTARSHVLKFDYCKKIIDFHRRLKACYKDALIEYDEKVRGNHSGKRINSRDQVFYESVIDKIQSSTFGTCFQRSIFVPATRSFFANLQKNVFSFLASNIEIDPFIKEFGARYESCKRFYGNNHIYGNKVSDDYRKKVDRLTRDIASGEYLYEEEKDWIQSDGRKTNLANASSGQQESIPMLLVLSVWPTLLGKDRLGTFIIEEPEAHLFPVSQKHIATLVAIIHRYFGHKFFITTHSPYILTAINNLIAAGDAFSIVDEGSSKERELLKVADKMETLSFEDVSAYTIQDGELIDIVDKESRLIGASVLDEVSDSFDRSFDSIAQILYGE